MEDKVKKSIEILKQKWDTVLSIDEEIEMIEIKMMELRREARVLKLKQLKANAERLKAEMYLNEAYKKQYGKPAFPVEEINKDIVELKDEKQKLEM